MAQDIRRRHSLILRSSETASGEGSAWARALAEKAGLSPRRIDALDLCIVELVTNVVNHSYRGQPGEIRLELGLGEDAAALTLIDAGPPFDPLSVPAPAIPASLDDLPVGGFGIHLVRTSADACEYRRHAGRNFFTVRFGGDNGRA